MKSTRDSSSAALGKRLLTIAQNARPDDVAAHYSTAKTHPGLNIRVIPAEKDSEGSPLLLIEGDELSLVFLADLLLAQAGDKLDCGYQLDKTSKSKFFGAGSEFGLYVHCVPCSHS